MAGFRASFEMPLYKLPVSMLTPFVTRQINNVLQMAWPGRSFPLQHTKYEWVAIVQHEGQIIGVVFTRHEQAWTYIEQLAVLPNFRRQGVARKLLQFLHTDVDTRNAHVLHVDAGNNHNALVRYYEKCGFEPVYGNNEETMLRREPFATAFAIEYGASSGKTDHSLDETKKLSDCVNPTL